MWKLKHLLVAMSFLVSCDQETEQRSACHGGTIMGRIRGAGGGVAVSVDDASFGNHSWHNASNVVELLNVPDSLWVPGLRVYFIARPATETEAGFPKSADGDESDKPLLFAIGYSLDGCGSIH